MKYDKKNEGMKYRGGCHCGRCKYECAGQPIFRTICHCTICTGISGGVAVALVGFSGSDFCVVEGAGLLRSYRASERMERYSCGVCSASVYNKSLVPANDFCDVPLASFERDAEGRVVRLEELKPESHMFFDRCMDCYRQAFDEDGLQKYGGMPTDE